MIDTFIATNEYEIQLYHTFKAFIALFQTAAGDDQTEGKPCKSQMNDKVKLISEVSANQNNSKKHQVSVLPLVKQYSFASV